MLVISARRAGETGKTQRLGKRYRAPRPKAVINPRRLGYTASGLFVRGYAASLHFMGNQSRLLISWGLMMRKNVTKKVFEFAENHYGRPVEMDEFEQFFYVGGDFPVGYWVSSGEDAGAFVDMTGDFDKIVMYF